MSNKQSVAIIGGGILGLTAAYELSKKNVNVTIFEKSSDWGGLASAVKVNDNLIERYYHHWFKSDKHIQYLIEELGLSDKLKWHISNTGIWDNGRLIDFSTSIDVLKFPLLNIFQRLRLGLISFYLQKTKNYKSFEKQTATDWCNKYFGKKVTDVLWKPLLIGKFGDDHKQVSMSWLWARIYDRASSRPNPLGKEQLGYMDGSFQEIINALISRLKENRVELINNATIEDHEYVDDTHKIVFSTPKLEGQQKQFSQIVSTVPGPIFLKLFDVDNEVRKKIEKTKYIGATCMLLVMKEKLMPYYWLSVTDPKAPFLAVIEHTNLIDSKEYNGERILYIAKYIDTKEELFQKNEDELFEIYKSYLKQINPEFNENWVKDKYLFKSAFAQHIVTTDFEIPPYTTNIPGLYYINFSQIHPHDRGTNFAVQQGREIANIVIN